MRFIPSQATRNDKSSLEISEILLARSWAAFHGLRMIADLDHRGDVIPSEEVVTFTRRGDDTRKWVLWRTSRGFDVQMDFRSPMSFSTMAEALNYLIPENNDEITDLSCQAHLGAVRPARPRLYAA